MEQRKLHTWMPCHKWMSWFQEKPMDSQNKWSVLEMLFQHPPDLQRTDSFQPYANNGLPWEGATKPTNKESYAVISLFKCGMVFNWIGIGESVHLCKRTYSRIFSTIEAEGNLLNTVNAITLVFNHILHGTMLSNNWPTLGIND